MVEIDTIRQVFTVDGVVAGRIEHIAPFAGHTHGQWSISYRCRRGNQYAVSYSDRGTTIDQAVAKAVKKIFR